MKFCENNKDIITLPKYKECFVYFLLKNNEVIYVGQTQHGLRRPLSHYDKDFDEIKFLYCSPNELDVLEDTFIQKYKPICNKQNNYAIRWSLLRVRNCIRKQTEYTQITIPILKKVLKNLNITPLKDCYNGKETITFDEHKTVIEYLRGADNGRK